MADSFIFNASAGETPETVARRRQVADALAARLFSRSPQNLGEGIGAIGQALIARQMSDEATAAQKAGQESGLQAYQQIASLLGGGTSPAAASSIPPVTSAAATPPMGNIPVQARTPSTSDKIYTNDEPSPLDPPSGQDRDLAIRTIVGEAGNQGPVGQNAVASVIRNRAVAGNYGGNTPSGVVLAPNQFEPWNGGPARDRMMALQPNDPRYAAAGSALDMAYAGNDPTNGATMFFAPKAQAALGRPAPTWGQGPGQDIGDHRFFGGAPIPPTQVASADPNAMPAMAPNAAPAPVSPQPQAPVEAAAPAPAAPQVAPQRQLSVAQLAQVASNPWLNEGQKGVVNALLKQAMDREQKAADPVYQAQLQAIPLDLAAKRKALEKSDEPNSVQEYNFYKQNFQPTDAQPKPMNYDVWATAKARAAATNVTTNVGADENSFQKEAGKVQAQRFNDLVGEGQQAKQLISDIGTLTDLGRNIGTGKGAQVRAAIGPYADALGVKVEGLSDIQAYEAIVNRVAPTLRVKGSGAQSDLELKNFLKSLPSLGNTQEGNDTAAAVLQGLQQNKVAAAEIASKALNGEITRAEADKQLRTLPDPMEPYRAYTKTNGSTAAPAAKVESLKKKYGLD